MEEILLAKKRFTLKSFIAKARDKHGDKYDYSKIKKAPCVRETVQIVCHKHDKPFTFSQQVINHIRFHKACTKCPFQSPFVKNFDSYQFVKRARKVHHDKYDYSKVIGIVTNQVEVSIICHHHEKPLEFIRTVGDHVNRGLGCQKCLIQENWKHNKNKLVKLSKQVHKHQYNYNLIKEEDIVDRKSTVEIKCRRHGIFKIRITTLLRQKNPVACKHCK